MSNLKKLISLCDSNIDIFINDHKSSSTSIDFYVENDTHNDYIHTSIRNKIIELDTIIQINFYPRTAWTFYTVWHYDIDLAIDEAIQIIERHET